MLGKALVKKVFVFTFVCCLVLTSSFAMLVGFANSDTEYSGVSESYADASGSADTGNSGDSGSIGSEPARDSGSSDTEYSGVGESYADASGSADTGNSGDSGSIGSEPARDSGSNEDGYIGGGEGNNATSTYGDDEEYEENNKNTLTSTPQETLPELIFSFSGDLEITPAEYRDTIGRGLLFMRGVYVHDEEGLQHNIAWVYDFGGFDIDAEAGTEFIITYAATHPETGETFRDSRTAVVAEDTTSEISITFSGDLVIYMMDLYSETDINEILMSGVSATNELGEDITLAVEIKDDGGFAAYVTEHFYSNDPTEFDFETQVIYMVAGEYQGVAYEFASEPRTLRVVNFIGISAASMPEQWDGSECLATFIERQSHSVPLHSVRITQASGIPGIPNGTWLYDRARIINLTSHGITGRVYLNRAITLTRPPDMPLQTHQLSNTIVIWAGQEVELVMTAANTRHITTGNPQDNFSDAISLVISGNIILNGNGIGGGVHTGHLGGAQFNSGMGLWQANVNTAINNSNMPGQGIDTANGPRSGITFRNIPLFPARNHRYLGSIRVSAIFSEGTVGIRPHTRFENVGGTHVWGAGTSNVTGINWAQWSPFLVGNSPNSLIIAAGNQVHAYAPPAVLGISIDKQVHSVNGVPYANIGSDARNNNGRPIVLVGQEVRYQVAVRNTGNTVLSSAIIRETLTGGAWVEGLEGVTVNGLNITIPSLAVGAQRTFIFAYTPTAANIGTLRNVVTVESGTVNDQDYEDVAVAEPPLAPVPGISIDKQVHSVNGVPITGTSTVLVGDAVQYSVTITNTGDIDLTNVVITETLLGGEWLGEWIGTALVSPVTNATISGMTITIPSFAAGAQRTFIFTYTTTVADAGTLRNLATVVADEGNEDEDEAQVTVLVPDQISTPGGGGGGGDPNWPSTPPPTWPTPPIIPPPEPPTSPDSPGSPNTPGTPPPPNNPDNTLVPNGEGWIEIDDEGVPLGYWNWDPEEEIWIFDPAVPLAMMPFTGIADNSSYLWVMLALSILTAVGTIGLIKRQR